jgi:tetratricopeptide (TPR) repeat protein
MKFLQTLLLATAMASGPLFTLAQNPEAQAHVNKGVELYDAGNYKGALAEYEKALAITPDDPGTLYEMAMTYEALQEYNKAIELCEKVLSTPNEHHKAAYVVLGSSHDDNGEPRKAMAVYKRGLAEFPGNYLLCYNLALTEVREEMDEEAEKHLMEGLKDNPNHPSSHFLLIALNEKKDLRVKTMLPMYYFALLEPQSQRGIAVLTRLQELWSQGVTKTGKKNVEIAVDAKVMEDEEWSGAEMTVSMLAAISTSKEMSKASPLERFTSSTETLFGTLGEMRENKPGFYWSFYVDFFYNLQQEGHTKTFVYYIFAMAGSEEADKWFKKHEAESQNFADWLKSRWDSEE